MESTKITFQADEQNLVKTSGVDVFASDTVSYIEADFSLGTNWQGYDSVRAMWKFGTDVYSTVLDYDGKCIVPWEVLTKRGELKVNLVGSISENGELTDRLTTFPIIALIISKIAQVEGDNSTPPTPSEYEQFVENVKADADRAEEAEAGAEAAQIAAEQARDEASQSASSALDYADSAQNAKNLAVQAKDYAIQQAQNAQQARYDAEQARDNAQTAESNAEGFAERAETAATNAESSASRIEGLIPTPTEDGKILVTNNGEYEISELVELGDDYIIGADNSVTHPSGTINPNAVIGKDNTLDGSQVQANRFGLNVVVGYNNTLDGRNTYGVVAGHYNEVKGQQVGTIIGSMNKVKVVADGTAQGYPTVLGSDNEILPPEGEYYNDAVLIGSGLKAGSNAQTIIGLYNEQNESIFAVADGRDNAPHNAFEINKDGEYSAKLNDTEITESKLRELKAVMLPTDTASGSIASFPDGADAIPMSSVKASINPIQDLHGQSSPYPAGGGVNKWDEEWEAVSNRIQSKNLIPVQPNTTYAWVSPSQPANGLRFYDSRQTLISTVYSVTGGVFTTPSDCYYIWFALSSSYGTTYNHDISINYPSTVTAYAPYSNICPISGTTEVVVTRAGKNLLKTPYILPEGTYADVALTIDADNVIHLTGTGGSSAEYFLTDEFTLPSGTYKVTTAQTNARTRVYVYKNGVYSSRSSTDSPYTITVAKGDVLKISLLILSATYANDTVKLMIEVGSSATTYEPYVAPLTITTQLGQTVYGGTVDVVSGVLTVEKAMVDMGTLTWSRYDPSGTNIPVFYARVDTAKVAAIPKSDIFKCQAWTNLNLRVSGTLEPHPSLPIYYVAYDGITNVIDFVTFVNGRQLVYELVTPITVQLTPTEVDTLLGTNNVWADSGDVEVTYKADIQKYIDKKISAVLNA